VAYILYSEATQERCALQFVTDKDAIFQTQLSETRWCYSGLKTGLIPEGFLFNEAVSSALRLSLITTVSAGMAPLTCTVTPFSLIHFGADAPQALMLI
jgi:hypothetical protein